MRRVKFSLLLYGVHLVFNDALLLDDFIELIAHNLCIQAVDNGGAQFDAFGRHLSAVDFNGGLYGFCTSCRVQKSGIQFTVQHHLYSTVFGVEPVYTNEFNLIFQTCISCHLPRLRSQLVIKGKNIQTLIAQRIQRFPEGFCRKSFEGSHQFGIRIIFNRFPKTKTSFGGGRRVVVTFDLNHFFEYLRIRQDVLRRFFPNLYIICADVSGILVRIDFPVQQNHRYFLCCRLFHDRNQRIGIDGRDDDDILLIINHFLDILNLLLYRTLRFTNAQVNLRMQRGLNFHRVIHRLTPRVVAKPL